MRNFGLILILVSTLAVACGDDDANNTSSNNATTNNATTNNATSNNATTNNATTNNATTNNATTNNATTGNNDDPVAVVRPGEGAVVPSDAADIVLAWTGGGPPYAVEFGADEGSLAVVATVMLNQTMLDTADAGVTADSSYVWRVTSRAGTADEVVGPVWAFDTVALGLDPCAGDPSVETDGQTLGTVQVGTTCWLDANLVYGNPLEDDSVDDRRIDKLCPRDGCQTNAYYTGWELYQWYDPDVENLAAREVAICPTGWVLPTQTQVEELETTLSDAQLAAFFPLDDGREPQVESLGECIVEGEFEFCTSFIAPELAENRAALWLAGTPTMDGLDYFTVTYANDTTTVDYGVRGASYAHSVRCVEDVQ